MMTYFPDISQENAYKYTRQFFQDENVTSIDRLMSRIERDPKWLSDQGIHKYDADDFVSVAKKYNKNTTDSVVESIEVRESDLAKDNGNNMWLRPYFPEIEETRIIQYTQMLRDNNIHTMTRFYNVILSNKNSYGDRGWLKENWIHEYDVLDMTDFASRITQDMKRYNTPFHQTLDVLKQSIQDSLSSLNTYAIYYDYWPAKYISNMDENKAREYADSLRGMNIRSMEVSTSQ